MARQVPVTDIYDKIYNSNKTIIVNRGGTRSSKSYSLAQYMIYLMTNEYNRKILISRKTMPALKETAYRDMITLLQDYGYYRYCDHNKTDSNIIYRPTNTYTKFISIDNPEKIRSTGWNYAWLEEAPEFTFDDYMTIKMRLSEPTDTKNQVFLSFNPSDAFCWVKIELIDKDPDVEEIISTYRDNPFLSAAYIKELEKMKSNPAYWKVFGEGEWGTLENIIYNNYTTTNKLLTDYNQKVYGLDFGYNHPTALIQIGEQDDNLYLKELLYQSELNNSQLIDQLLLLIDNKNDYIYADTAEPARIDEIRKAGFNIHPSDKSVKDGLDFCKRQKLYVLDSSINLIKEFRSYQYKEKDGHPIDDPVKFNDHLMDAMRYAIYNHWGKRIEYKIVI